VTNTTYRGHHSTTYQSTGSSEFIRHGPCNNCGSSDGNAIYTDHSYCFVCHTYTKSDENPVHIHNNNKLEIKGSAERLQKRKISQATCEKFKVYRDGDKLRFYYHDPSGIVKGAKIKTKHKQFTYEGESPGTFFGQHLWSNSGKRIIITEGELDCVSYADRYPTWPVVSLPSGAAGAKKAVQKNLEFLQGYEEIVLWFDSDEPGQKAAEDAAGVLPPGKAYIARLEAYKDLSDALQASDYNAIDDAFFKRKEFRPDGIVDAKSLLEVLTTPQPPADYDYPFQGLEKELRGIRLGELTTITAGSGIGKSSFCREIAAHLLQQKVRVGYLALEESVRRTGLGLMSVGVRQSLHLEQRTNEELTEAFDKTVKDWDLFLFDGFGSYEPDIIYNRIEYMASGLNCKVIFLDHLSILMSGLEGDERRMIDVTMTRLRSLVERTGIALFLVCHTTTPTNGQSHEEGGRVQLRNLRGSRSIGQLSDNVIALERDQQSESDRNTTIVRVLKNRNSGEDGVACKLNFNLSTCKFNETTEPAEFDATTDF